jgi:signal peptidase II
MCAIAFMLWRPHHAGMHDTVLLRIGLALVFGGALGNLWDRVFAGTVTDFLQVFFGSYEFPAFNAADSAITIGAGLLLIDLWRTRHHHAPQ